MEGSESNDISVDIPDTDPDADEVLASSIANMSHKSFMSGKEAKVGKKGEKISMEGSKSNHTSVDIPDTDPDADEVLASSIANMSHKSFLSAKCSIFKTPSILLRHDEKAYVPDAFSIGPLHHGKRRSRDAEKIKLQYLHDLISRTDTSLKECIKAIRGFEGEARECYAVPLNHLSVDDFVKILVVDGCFIVELLRKYSGEVDANPDDPVFNMDCMHQFLLHDLLLLENQIPWKVLECLFKMTERNSESLPELAKSKSLPNLANSESQPQLAKSKSLPELAIMFLYGAFSMHTPSVDYRNHEILHMLELLRYTLLFSFEQQVGEYFGSGWKLIPNATSLEEAGIKFQKSNSTGLLNIKFSNGVLEIPPLMIHETTDDALRNLISFEQCYRGCPAVVTSYAILLDNLITTTKDINILRKEGIINNWLNPEDAIKFFNELYHDACIGKFYYVGLCKQVNDYCHCPWPRFRAKYVRNHFSNPLAIASQAVAGIVLVLTFLQTIYSIKK